MRDCEQSVDVEARLPWMLYDSSPERGLKGCRCDQKSEREHCGAFEGLFPH